jgi:beta-lactam-binding protein with PASTA domain
MTRRDAQAQLRRVGLRVGKVTTEGGGGDQLLVVQQSPSAGRQVRRGTAVDLVLQPVVY